MKEMGQDGSGWYKIGRDRVGRDGLGVTVQDLMGHAEIACNPQICQLCVSSEPRGCAQFEICIDVYMYKFM